MLLTEKVDYLAFVSLFKPAMFTLKTVCVSMYVCFMCARWW